MEELNDTPHPDFIKGFNDGYLMAKHLPDLSKDLAKSLSDTEQSKGFEAGIRQVFLEKVKGFEPAWMKDDIAETGQVKSKEDKGLDKE
jgi:hypothetical protein